ncbi:hypothetical protein [Thalassobacillus sp. CUG 92003]|uniref:hypothetical protein n=1 Tax=Thalassobacillus sp. CUG 92003 TaxID=2736641 RepID=UPI0015E6CA06|nr:hypothetical protein [Thalassobacillus sp. CUG 92003]
MTNKKREEESAVNTLQTGIDEINNSKAQEIADVFLDYLDDFHALSEVWDNELDTQINRWYANAPKLFPKRPYFSPSSANACPRMLYMKAKRAKKDNFDKQPHQTRWAAIGTAIGSVIQRDILAMERNYEKKRGKPTPFKFERTPEGFPQFEDFAKKNHRVEHNGKSFYLYGTCDGILEYADPETGELLRVGLEIKSKQTSAAKTSHYSMRQPEEKHVKQCVAYAEMYNVSKFIILYVNAAKKTWVYDDDTYAKNPDIRAFGVNITEADKRELFDYFTKVQTSIDANDPLPLDLDNWTFNNFKQACATSLSDDELAELQRKKKAALKSNMPGFKKAQIVDAVEQIEQLREEAE